jgi:hypothetical protein
MSTPTDEQLQTQFQKISRLLYDTKVSTHRLEQEVMPHIAEDVVFLDPWQEGSGRDRYRLGLAGFHQMLRFDLDLFQTSVTVDRDAGKGRAMVDGVMHLNLLQPLLSYPLRTFLVYEFTLLPKAPGFLIHRHEEMWSLGDMIAAVPGLGGVYKNVFRKAFCRGFLAASWLSTRGKQSAG